MIDHTELFTIGQLAARTGLPVRTIRFWSDREVITPTGRSAAGYRLYDAEAVARLELVRTLRELGLDLATVRQVLRRQVSIADVARRHAEALDAEIRMLQLRRAVLWSVAQRSGTTKEMTVMHKLAQLSARERQHLIEEFVARAFDGIDPQAPGAHIAGSMRQLPASLPADPTPEQVDAWVELAELVSDESFQQRVRQMALTGAQASPAEGAPHEPADEPSQQHQPPLDPAAVTAHADLALAAGIAPDSEAARAVIERIVGPDLAGDQRRQLADQLATFTDRRVERYWQLLGILNGWPPAAPSVPAFEWLIAALRAHA